MPTGVQIGSNFYFAITPSGGSKKDLSDHVTSMQSKQPLEVKDYVPASTSGLPIRSRLLGVRDNQLDVTFVDDNTALSVRPTLESAFGLPCAIEFGFYGSTPGTTTPIYSYTAIFADLPEGSKVGEIMEVQISFMISSGTRTTTTS